MATYPTLWVQLDDGIFEETLEAGQEISLRWPTGFCKHGPKLSTSSQT
jgi:hypothetical protein